MREQKLIRNARIVIGILASLVFLWIIIGISIQLFSGHYDDLIGIFFLMGLLVMVFGGLPSYLIVYKGEKRSTLWYVLFQDALNVIVVIFLAIMNASKDFGIIAEALALLIALYSIFEIVVLLRLLRK